MPVRSGSVRIRWNLWNACRNEADPGTVVEKQELRVVLRAEMELGCSALSELTDTVLVPWWVGRVLTGGSSWGGHPVT